MSRRLANPALCSRVSCTPCAWRRIHVRPGCDPFEELGRVLGSLVVHARLAAGLTQRELAAAAGTSQATLSRTEGGRLDILLAGRAAVACGVSPDDYAAHVACYLDTALDRGAGGWEGSGPEPQAPPC